MYTQEHTVLHMVPANLLEAFIEHLNYHDRLKCVCDCMFVSGWQGDQMPRLLWSSQYLNELFSFKFGPAISIDRMAFVCFPPVGFAAIIHLHASNRIKVQGTAKRAVFNELYKGMRLGSNYNAAL